MRVFSFCLFLVIGLSVNLVNGQKTKIKSAQISFEFVSKKVKGTISGFKSESSIDVGNLENSIFKGSVSSETLDTNSGLRNWSLKSGKYFDADDYPKISFKSNKVKLEGEKLVVNGELTIKETLKPITITFTRKENQLIGTTSLYSIDYGIKIKKKREDNLVKIKMVFDINS
ncbi:YceI family protein [Flagellimonas sp. CMM7]|uniref:YceI family protein n=1 Tax=Flagellimonas sp. CMM7 TaxID=2654676 RepID=UPI0013D50B05|nr:YceI family protein [Flagellimonas sp. CMM7]UII79479.1 YceI family protein [Flagellimonas sp. CMM7]